MPQNSARKIFSLLGLLLMVSSIGCASAYHTYSGCNIRYQYCAPSPLPHASYPGDHCPTPAAGLYASDPMVPSEKAPEPSDLVDLPSDAPK